jgi:hypothetical protein
MKENMMNFPCLRWIIFQQEKQQWICCYQYPSGRLLVVEPDYLLDSKVLFSNVFGPHFMKGTVGGLPSLTFGVGRGGEMTI